MVDYSKWDKLDISDEEEERPKPRVQKFERPQTVTIGQTDQQPEVNDVEMDEDDDDEPFETEDDACQPGEDRREDVLQCRTLGERALRNGDPVEGVRLFEKAMRLGGCPGLEEALCSARAQLAATQSQAVRAAGAAEQAKRLEANHQSNGGLVEGRYCWSQTKETLELNVFVPEGTKAKEVKVDISDTQMAISVGQSKMLAGEWEFKVDPEEDPDWELRECNGKRAIHLLVRKAPMPGGMSVAVWWSRVLKGEPAIDVSAIEGRKRDRQKSEQFAQAWKDAHAMFRESIKNRSPVEVETQSADEKM